jgi:plastocyanin
MNGYRVVVVSTALCAVLAGAPAWVCAQGGASLSGKVLFEGEAPAAKEIQFGAEKQCALLHQHAPTAEDVVVNSNHTLRWVLVYVKEDVPDDYPVPTEPVVMNQVGCLFIPHVVAVRVGQPVTFLNDDPVLHNVRGMSKLMQAFNVAQPVKGMKATKTFSKPEIGMKLKCDVHFWMTGYLHVLPHPFFAVTGEDGTFAIAGVPPGTYTLEAWHETLGTQAQSVTMTDSSALTLDFTFRTP